MTTEEFWDKYIDEDILEIFEDTCAFFSKELPQDFLDEYDVSEVLLETRGKQESEKNFDNVLRFTEIIRDKQPELYQENFQYFDDFLVDYHCYHGKQAEVEKGFDNFLKKPIHDYDAYLISFKKLLFYQKTDLIKKAISENFDKIQKDDSLMEGAAYTLAVAKYYFTLEYYYLEKGLDAFRKEFADKLKKYEFDFEESFFIAMEKGVFSEFDKTENLVDAFSKDRFDLLLSVHGGFLKYMLKKNFSFALSGRIWDNLLNIWEQKPEEETPTPDLFFQLPLKEFDNGLSNISGAMFQDNTSEMIALLWGSVYVYDFLKSIEIINQKTYDNFLHTSRVLKGREIAENTSGLWNSNFVHSWEKPDSVSATEFEAEEALFKKSITLKNKPFNNLRKKIVDELENMGDLKKHIVQGVQSNREVQGMSLMEKMMGAGTSNNITPTHAPIHVEKKIGRNDPCSCGSGKKYKKCCGK